MMGKLYLIFYNIKKKHKRRCSFLYKMFKIQQTMFFLQKILLKKDQFLDLHFVVCWIKIARECLPWECVKVYSQKYIIQLFFFLFKILLIVYIVQRTIFKYLWKDLASSMTQIENVKYCLFHFFFVC